MKRFNKIYLPLTFALLTLGIAACDNKQNTAQEAGKSIDQSLAKTQEKIEAKSDKMGEFMDDTAITAKVKTAIVAESDLSSTSINVETANGVTTLTGEVDSATNRDRATDVVAKVEGVKSVNNSLTVVAEK
jgi:hyperosmotically inducible periplasmic protein